MNPFAVDVIDSPSTWIGILVSALASVAALAGIWIAVGEARRARADSASDKAALDDERADREKEGFAAEARDLAAQQATQIRLMGSWSLGPYENGNGLFSVNVVNESAQPITDLDVFVLPPITLRPGDDSSSRASQAVFTTPIVLRSGNSNGDASFTAAVLDRNHPHDEALPPRMEMSFTDYLGNRWFRGSNGSLALTKKAAGPIAYDPTRHLGVDWRSTT
jgi:hypothetical protein